MISFVIRNDKLPSAIHIFFMEKLPKHFEGVIVAIKIHRILIKFSAFKKPNLQQ